MGQAARVTSIDAVRDMAAAITSFRDEASAALEELEMEIRRALEWIHHDRKEHWSDEVRRGWQHVTEARVQLQQAQMSRRIAEHEPSCFDEKKTLERTKRRLEVSQQKVEVVRHWVNAIDHAVNEYRGSRSQLAGWLDSDVPAALSALARITETLESYLAIAVPGGAAPLGPDGGGGPPDSGTVAVAQEDAGPPGVGEANSPVVERESGQSPSRDPEEPAS